MSEVPLYAVRIHTLKDLQGYIAHQKQTLPRTLQYALA